MGRTQDLSDEPVVIDMTYLDPEAVDPRQRAEAWKRSGELCRAMNERAAEQRRLYGRGAISLHRAPARRGRGRGPSGRPAGRRRTGASSRTASADPGDPGDPDPEPAQATPLRASEPPRARYTFGVLTPAERGQVVS